MKWCTGRPSTYHSRGDNCHTGCNDYECDEGFKIAAIKAPYYEKKDATCSMILRSTGATVTRESGQKLQEVELSDLGTARAIESNKYTSTIVGGNVLNIDERIEHLKSQITDQFLTEAEFPV